MEGKNSQLKSEAYRSPISEPMAGDRLAKKLIKLASTFSDEKLTRRGVKEVVKALRKKKRGIVVLAGDISPIELVAHIPILCENNGIPYIYVRSKDDLGQASLSKRPTTVLMINRPSKSHEQRGEYKELFEKVLQANPYLA